jgi:hypothetical protein
MAETTKEAKSRLETVLIVIVALIGLFICFLLVLPSRFSQGSKSQSKASVSRCENAGQEQIYSVRDGIKEINPLNDIGPLYAVKSGEFERAYFLSANIYSGNAMVGSGPGVWFMFGPKDDPHLMIAVSDSAVKYSIWPDAREARVGALFEPKDYDYRITMSSDGAKESEQCAIGSP